MEPNVSTIHSVTFRKVTNGIIANVARTSAGAPPLFPGQQEERVFTSWNDFVSFLSAEGFI